MTIRTIFKYKCGNCGWTGEDVYPSGPYETKLFAIGNENEDACPICADRRPGDESCVTNLELVEVVKEE